MQTLSEHFDAAGDLHHGVISVLREEEQATQNEWLSSIKSYSITFMENVEKWLDKNTCCPTPADINLVAINKDACHSQMDDATQAATEALGATTLHGGSQDDMKPSDSVSNVESRQSSQGSSGKRSSIKYLFCSCQSRG